MLTNDHPVYTTISNETPRNDDPQLQVIILKLSLHILEESRRRNALCLKTRVSSDKEKWNRSTSVTYNINNMVINRNKNTNFNNFEARFNLY